MNEKIFVVKHGEYEDKRITLVTFDIDKACKFLIEFGTTNCIYDCINGIEIWQNEKLLIDYGCLTVHIINKLTEKELINDGWIKIKNDIENLLLTNNE